MLNQQQTSNIMQKIDRQWGMGEGKSLGPKALRPLVPQNDASVKIQEGGI